MSGTEPVRILIADDHKIFREGLKALLEKQRNITVVAEAEDGLKAVRLVAELKPQLVIMDVSMPQLNGIEASRQILSQNTGVRVIALSMHADRRFVVEALKSGVQGYLLKDSAFEELAMAIRAVMQGRNFLSATITEMVVKDYLLQAPSDNRPSVFAVLSAREREVLQMLAEGSTTKEIAGRLEISVKTVETFRKQIMDKLNLHSIAELTKFAIREGLTTL